MLIRWASRDEVQNDKDDGSTLIGDEQVESVRDPEVQGDKDDDPTLIGDELDNNDLEYPELLIVTIPMM